LAKKVKIKGVIISNEWKGIYDWFGYDSTCPKDIEDALDIAQGADIEMDINSGGGDVYAGSEIYSLLKSYKGNITGRIVGIAASAASVIGMGCTKLVMAPTAQIMIHNVSSGAYGDYRNLQHNADVLKGWNTSIANAYQLKTGMEQKDLLKLMDKETWMTAQQALESKFIDEVMFDQSNRLAASFGSAAYDEMIPTKILDKLRNSGLLKDKMQFILENNVQEGVKGVNFEDILAKLSDEEKQFLQDHIATTVSNTVTTSTATLQEEKTTLENSNAELQAKLEAIPQPEPTQDDVLANASPEIKALLDDANRKAMEAEANLQQMQDEKELSTFVAEAQAYDKLPINATEFGPVLRNFAKADSEGFEKLRALLTAVNNATETGAIFSNKGSNKPVEGNNAWEKIQSLVKTAMENNSKISQPDAMLNVIKENPELYQEYLKEMEGDE